MSQPKVIVRWKCDQCGKVVDRPSEVGVSNRMPEGWHYIAWHTEPAEDAHGGGYQVNDVTVCGWRCGALFLDDGDR